LNRALIIGAHEVVMFKQIISTQGQALEQMMSKQPTDNPALMNEAQTDLKNAIDKAVKAAGETTNASA